MGDGIFSGLGSLGLGGLEGLDIFGEEEKKEKEKAAQAAPEVTKIQEKDLIYDKSYRCPVCNTEFTAKIMKTGKVKLLGTDSDLRARYEGIDPLKYDVELCPVCGYGALSRYFTQITPTQAKLVREQIGQKVNVPVYKDEIYSYEQALERYKLALVSAVVKRGKTSEKAYICLKSGWLVRGYKESLEEEKKLDAKTKAALDAQENEYLMNAYKGFVEARQSEGFPMCGMDEITIDYLIAVLSARFGKYDVASRLVASILSNPSANARMKERARELKEEIMEKFKNKTQG